jgi:hypothetical protein
LLVAGLGAYALTQLIEAVFRPAHATGTITNLTWKSWGSKSAWGTGKIWTQKAGCSPSYKCRFSSRWVGISLTTIKKHGARPYYDRMAVEMRVGTKMHWFVGWFKYYPGATVPSWIFPLVWPYL